MRENGIGYAESAFVALMFVCAVIGCGALHAALRTASSAEQRLYVRHAPPCLFWLVLFATVRTSALALALLVSCSKCKSMNESSSLTHRQCGVLGSRIALSGAGLLFVERPTSPLGCGRRLAETRASLRCQVFGACIVVPSACGCWRCYSG